MGFHDVRAGVRGAFLALLAITALSPRLSAKDCVSGKMKMNDVPKADKDDLRTAKFQITSGAGGLTVFNNNEGILPSLPARGDDQYFEFYLGADRSGGAGTHRAVIHAATKNGKRNVVDIYFTTDHYASFKEVVEN